MEKARRGKVISRAAAPFGYRFDPESSTLMIHEDEAEAVRLIFRFYTQDRMSLVKLADTLNRLGISAPPGPVASRNSLKFSLSVQMAGFKNMHDIVSMANNLLVDPAFFLITAFLRIRDSWDDHRSPLSRSLQAADLLPS